MRKILVWSLGGGAGRGRAHNKRGGARRSCEAVARALIIGVYFLCFRVGPWARFRVRRAGRARQGAADAARRARRSLMTARDADAADRRRRFDMRAGFRGRASALSSQIPWKQAPGRQQKSSPLAGKREEKPARDFALRATTKTPLRCRTAM